MSSDSLSSAALRLLPGILAALIAAAGAAIAAPSAKTVRAVLPMENDAWHRGPPGFPGGSMFAVVSGDPLQTGPFMIRVELPGGYRLPPHRRPRDESIVVLAGAIEVGTRTLPAGSFIRLPANEWTSLSTQTGATLQIFGDGPFELSAAAR
jgi:quercetin dioxygenase-like cupin family protein